MIRKRPGPAAKCAAVAALLGLCAGAPLAQETDAARDEDQEEDTVEEIVVIAPKPGSRRRVDEDYEDPLKLRILKELYEMRADREESEWREELARANGSRIKLGYDPRDEYRLRNEMDLTALPTENTKPATLFRFRF